MGFFEDIGPVASIASGFVPGVGGALLGGLGAIGGLLGASAERKRQEQARQMALARMSAQLDQQYNDLVSSHARTLAEQTGYGGDALMSLARGLGSANAAAGVTNSSAVAGSNVLAQQNTQRELSSLAAQNRDQELQQLGSNKNYIAGLQYNLAGENFNNAGLREQQAGSGLAKYLGSLGQFNLQNMNAPNARNFGNVMNGNQNGALQYPAAASVIGGPGGAYSNYLSGNAANQAAGSTIGGPIGSYAQIPQAGIQYNRNMFPTKSLPYAF